MGIEDRLRKLERRTFPDIVNSRFVEFKDLVRRVKCGQELSFRERDTLAMYLDAWIHVGLCPVRDVFWSKISQGWNPKKF
jgi:hypothetical protein